jgi:hypothetical protein
LARRALEQSRADIVSAAQRPDPQLSFTVQNVNSSRGIGGGDWRGRTVDSILRVDQLVERAGKAELRVETARRLESAASEDVPETARQQTLALRGLLRSARRPGEGSGGRRGGRALRPHRRCRAAAPQGGRHRRGRPSAHPRRCPARAERCPLGSGRGRARLALAYLIGAEADAGLRAHRLMLAQLYAALERGNANAGGGYVEQGGQQYTFRGIGLLREAGDIENIVLAERNGTPVLVRDVAAVVVGSTPRQGTVGPDEDDDAVTGVVLMRKGENPSKVLAGVKQRVAELNNGGLPAGVTIASFYDRTWLIGKTLKTVFRNLVEGALLVSIVLYLFLANLRAAAIVALIIPLSLLSTFVGLTFVGIPANLLSLGAMDFGIIVDGAVIVVENVFRRLSSQDEFRDAKVDGREERYRMRIIIEAAVEVGRPTLFSMIIIIAAHIPIFTLERHEGRIFAPMAYSVTAALIGSLILSLTLAPLLCHKWLSRNLPSHDNTLVSLAKRAYAPLLDWSLANRTEVIGVALLGLAVSVAVLARRAMPGPR